MKASTRYRRFQPRLHQLEDRATPAAGMLDPTFGDGGRVTSRLPTASGEEGRATAIDSMGRILVAGSGSDGLGSDFAITRYLPEGALDTSFGGTGIVTIDLGSAYDEAYSVAVDSLDRVVVAGTTYRNTAIGSYSDFAVARLTVSGALDASFDSDGKQTVDFWHSDEAYAVAVDSLDRIVVVGRGYNQFSVARLTAAGALDTTFDGDGKWFGISGGSAAFGVAVDSLDRILVAGYQYGLTSDFDFAVVRLTAAGALDPSFGAAGSQIISFGSRADYARSVAVDSMDRVVVAGITSYESTPTTSSFAVARLTSSGELDASFDADGKQTIAIGPYYGESGVAVDSLDRVVVVGSTYSGPDSNFAVARLTAAGALDTSFDGDGKQTISFGGFDNLAYGVAVDWRNRIVVAGEASRDFAVARL